MCIRDRSLGFRGEALSSIAAVSRTTITSRPQGQEHAQQISLDFGSGEFETRPAAHQIGTTVEVRDLFFNVPARRKFLRTDKTEYNHIEAAVRKIALAAWHVSFAVSHNGKQQLSLATPGDSSTGTKFCEPVSEVQKRGEARVQGVLGSEFLRHALYFERPAESLSLSGWVAQPTFSRSQAAVSYTHLTLPTKA